MKPDKTAVMLYCLIRFLALTFRALLSYTGIFLHATDNVKNVLSLEMHNLIKDASNKLYGE